jgi:hypothetical protein
MNPKTKEFLWSKDFILLIAAITIALFLFGMMALDIAADFPALGGGRGYHPHTRFRFVSENIYFAWLGRLALTALFAYAIQFFGSKLLALWRDHSSSD